MFRFLLEFLNRFIKQFYSNIRKEDPDMNKYECYPRPFSICKAYGDPHITTFDNAKIDVYGRAQYLYSASNGTLEGAPQFKILANTEPIRHVSRNSKIYVSFPLQSGEMIEFELDTSGKPHFYMKATGWKRAYPQRSNEFKFRQRGKKQILRTWFGLIVNLRGRNLRIIAPAFYDGQTYGLCQNKNQDQSDDFTMHDGTELTYHGHNGYKLSNSEYLVGKSWIIASRNVRGCFVIDF